MQLRSQFLLLMVLSLASAMVCAQERDYPSRPVRMIVPVPPGGIVDVVMRVVGQKMSEVMGQTLVIDNRPGATTNIGTEIVARAPADGYTLLSNSLPLVVNPSMFAKLPFDVEKDLTPVSLIAAAPYILVSHPALPAKSLKEMIALAKAKPGTIKYSSAGNGSNLHVAAELFKVMSGTDLVHVPYRGGGPALTAVLGNEAQLSFLSLIAVAPHVQAGKLRALGITSLKRSPVLPEVPTIDESGVTGYEFSSWVGVLAPGKTPRAIVSAIHGIIEKAARSPGMGERFATEGAEIVASRPEQFREYIHTELARWAKVVKETGMRPD